MRNPRGPLILLILALALLTQGCLLGPNFKIPASSVLPIDGWKKGTNRWTPAQRSIEIGGRYSTIPS